MSIRKIVYLLVLSGTQEDAQLLANSRYPGSEIAVLSKRSFHEKGWIGKARELGKLKGAALVVFSGSLLHIDQPKLLLCASLLHGCRETVFASDDGTLQVYTKSNLLTQVPQLFLSGLLDVLVLAGSWLGLHLISFLFAKPAREKENSRAAFDVAFLYPFPLQRVSPGGEMSYLKGFLSGLHQESARCEIVSGCSLPIEQYPVQLIPNRRRFYLLRESQALSYNLRYAWAVAKEIRRRRPCILYQRHGRFVLVGAILSRILGIPLALEYQCSELWRAQNWDPGHFLGLIRLCEDLTISCTSLFVVLSEALRDELVARGVPGDNIILNPAAVDPERFRPGCGGSEIRKQLGFRPEQVVVGFVGSFSYYHGISVLQSAIARLQARQKDSLTVANLRFLLVGDGVLRPEMQEALSGAVDQGTVVFAGTVAHTAVPSYLDACDILVSPHVPMPDGRPFFGSPSKLFEYMAMGKAIVASDMDQLSAVLSHDKTAWLVAPGSDLELSDAVELLAENPELRRTLGRNAHYTALERYTWRHNAVRMLEAAKLRAEVVTIAHSSRECDGSQAHDSQDDRETPVVFREQTSLRGSRRT